MDRVVYKKLESGTVRLGAMPTAVHSAVGECRVRAGVGVVHPELYLSAHATEISSSTDAA